MRFLGAFSVVGGQSRARSGYAGRRMMCSLSDGKREEHTPVLLEEVIGHFPGRMETFVDCTVGGGGHAEALLSRCEIGRYIGIDKDPYALSLCGQRLKGFGNVELIRSDFRDVRDALREVGVSGVDGMLVDLGVSSMQIDGSERGFSFMRDGPLDMRMSSGWDGAGTAADIVNGASERELADLLWRFGEERMSRKIAGEIVKERRRGGRIERTGQLVEVVERVKRRGKGHAATLVFQALRIAVNGELRALEGVLEDGVEMLRMEGRMAVISFHSLEDRMVKHGFRERDKVQVITKRCIRAGEEECKRNVRSRSAKMRVAKRVEI